MGERRTLAEGLTVDPQREKEFVYGARAAEPISVPSQPSNAPVHDRVPISSRIRGDFATALKRASLERELNGIEPHAVQDILEQALEPWLKANGYIH